ECRSFEKANKLAEARAKALEAQRLSADYASSEDRPENALIDIAQKAAAQINTYVDDAMKLAGPRPSPQQAGQAQAMLAQSKDFAQRMGFDTFAIDEKMNWLKAAGSARPVASSAPKPAEQRPDVKAAGREMLIKANL